MQIVKSIKIVLILLIFFVGCEKNTLKQEKWIEVPDSKKYMGDIKYCIAYENNLYSYSNSAFFIMDKDDNIRGYDNWFQIPKDYLFPISNSYFLEYGSYALFFRPTKNPTLNNTMAIANLSIIDTCFLDYNFDGFDKGIPVIGINKNFCLVPVTNKFNNNPTFHLISIKESNKWDGTYLSVDDF